MNSKARLLLNDAFVIDNVRNSRCRCFELLSSNPTNWSNTLKEFFSNNIRIVLVCLTVLWDWRLKGLRFRKIFRKTAVLESLFFNAVQAGGLFNFQRKFFYKRPRGDCFCDVVLVVFIS